MNYNKLSKSDSCCDELVYFLDEKKLPLHYNSRLNTLEMLSLSNSWIQEISYCPFCGSSWENSLENRWLEEVEKLGIEGDFLEVLQRVPSHLKTSEWWKTKMAKE